MVQDFQTLLWSLELRRIVHACGWFDLTDLIHGAIEMTLRAAGVQRRAGSTESSNPQGDVTGHTAALAAPYAYAGFLEKAAASSTTRPLPLDSHALRVIEAFVERSRARGVKVVAGLPNRSRYPLACFFDTLSHLHEDCQVQHSEAVGLALRSAGPNPG